MGWPGKVPLRKLHLSKEMKEVREPGMKISDKEHTRQRE